MSITNVFFTSCLLKKLPDLLRESCSRTLQGRVKPALLPRGPQGRAQCRYCRSEVPKKRRTFCSPACIHEHKLRSSIDYMREEVLKRDKGVCSQCGLDCVALLAAVAKIGAGDLAITHLTELGFSPFRACRAILKGAALWDADHIVAVAQGGGGCGLEGMRTLCARCHAVETRDLRKMLALGIPHGQKTLWDFALDEP